MQTNRTLNGILGIIDRDVKKIRKAGKQGPLTGVESQNLVRYGEFLFKMDENQEKEKERSKKQLDKLSTEELIKLYQKTESENDDND
jgi:hypothetical protein